MPDFSIDPSVLDAIKGLWQSQSVKNTTRPYNVDNWQDLLPPPPEAAIPDPLVIAQPEQARAIHHLINQNPYAKRDLKGVTMGPTAGTMEAMGASKMPMHSFARTNLLGAYDPQRSEIALSPRLYNDDRRLLDTAVHELSHAIGFNEPDSARIGKMVR